MDHAVAIGVSHSYLQDSGGSPPTMPMISLQPYILPEREVPFDEQQRRNIGSARLWTVESFAVSASVRYGIIASYETITQQRTCPYGLRSSSLAEARKSWSHGIAAKKLA